MLHSKFFDRDPQVVAQDLLGKVLRVRHENLILSAQIIETESYYLEDKASHASLGFTEKRKALFMPAGTIYMYYARGGDSLNISCHGPGNAVLIKSGYPYLEDLENLQEHDHPMIQRMQLLNPASATNMIRAINKLCCGQTLVCRSLGLKVPQWDQKTFVEDHFYVEDVSYVPAKIIQTTRLGIPTGRDEGLMYRFIDYDYASFCTSNPLAKRSWVEGKDYQILDRS